MDIAFNIKEKAQSTLSVNGVVVAVHNYEQGAESRTNVWDVDGWVFLDGDDGNKEVRIALAMSDALRFVDRLISAFD